MTEATAQLRAEEERHRTRFRDIDTPQLLALRAEDLTPAAQRALAQELAERNGEGVALATGAATAADGDRLVGVAGWLKLLIVVLAIGPLFGMMAEVAQLMLLNERHPELWSSTRWRVFVAIEFVVMLAQFAFCVWAAVGLQRLRTRAAVTRAYFALWSGMAATLLLAVVAGIVLGATVGGAVMGETGRSFIAVTIWTLYLANSKRVRATYGPPAETGLPARAADGPSAG